MKKAAGSVTKILSAVLISAVLVGCGNSTYGSSTSGVTEKYPEVAELKKDDMKLTVWTVYWDTQRTVRNIMTYSDKIDAISTFAAYYDENEKLFIPDETLKISRKLRNYKKTENIQQYLSVVNDKPDSMKDTSLLENKIGTAEKAEEQAEEIVRMAVENEYDGVEIDFEKIRSDLNLWDKFIVFEKDLITLCQKNGLKLRIVLETSTPVEDLNFPDGASYSVMCYNLYGIGTKPGPKADAEFLKKIAEKFGSLPGISYALANGGFDFDGTGAAKQLTSAEAAQLAKDKNVAPVRNKENGALTFSYGSHTVWYADEKTLVFWQKVLNEAAGKDVDIDLWRI
jgi:spore germination protein YaaH